MNKTLLKFPPPPLPPLTGAHMTPSLLKVALFFLVLASSLQGSTSVSDPIEVWALEAIKITAGDVFNKLENWVGDDPCGTNWTGVFCTPINGTEYVTELRLWNMNFTGTLAPDLVNLTQLSIINFMWNNLTGSIPPEIGYLRELVLLLLSGNKLTGTLPPELGNLSKLDRLQIDENNVSGPIPSTYQFLNKVKHFHMNNNSLNGSIPPELGRLEIIAHFLLDSNNLSGELPSELSNISTLLIVQLDNNHFSGSIPASYKNMSQLTKLSLRNCNLSGSIPDLSAISTLTYLDLSHNQLTGNLPSNLSQALRTIDWSYNQLEGELPSSLYGLRNLELVLMQNNSLDGTLRADLLTHNPFTDADSVFIMDFQNNNFTGLTSGALLDVSNVTLRLSGNPVCEGSSAPSDQCVEFNGVDANITTSATRISLPPSCSPATCDASRNQELHYGLLAFNICECAYPLVVGYRLKSPSFAIYQPYETVLENYLSLRLNLFQYQVNASDFTWEPGPRLAINIRLFPSNGTNQFSPSDVSRLYNQFMIWNISGNKTFGPHELLFFTIGFPYNVSLTVAAAGSRSGLKAGAIVGIVIGAAAFAAVLVAAVILVVAKHKHMKLNALSRKKTVRHHESIKVDGVKDFTFKQMMSATNNFDTEIGQGGYGRVYKGCLGDGSVVAIKRAYEGSLQGGKEFSTELEVLSRVHHRNLVGLIGFCDDEGEQMLIYEFMENGTLRDHLKSSSEPPLDFATRIQIALGSARGILYLHTEADPPIFHRDIKASNILLDKNMRAKVADFGISRLAPVDEVGGGAEFGYVSTVVKGTPGYVDPEYFLTQKLTDKSDVYSFGVVLLELITGQEPIYKGKNLVREVSLAHEAGMVMSIVDQRMGSYPSECLDLLLRLAMRCCMDETEDRPSTANVVQELEAIWRLMRHWESKVSFESSPELKASAVKQRTGLALNNPYVSSDIDGSGLVSGYIPSITPR